MTFVKNVLAAALAIAISGVAFAQTATTTAAAAPAADVVAAPAATDKAPAAEATTTKEVAATEKKCADGEVVAKKGKHKGECVKAHKKAAHHAKKDKAADAAAPAAGTEQPAA